MTTSILASQPLRFPWQGVDPFLMCAYHVDRYPAATPDQAVPAQHLQGRQIGNDFAGQDGFSMYHGAPVPGFPAHPHRGFETVTIVERGLVDHSDSLGAAARYGDGDVQWLTAGAGAMHAEMFPLRDQGAGNPLDLYQIWLNLPARSKMADPAFTILWDGDIPRYRTDTGAEVKVIAGPYTPQEEPGAAPLVPPPPTPNSWAADPASELAIWLIALKPGARLVLPPAASDRPRRTLYVHGAGTLQIDGNQFLTDYIAAADPLAALSLANTAAEGDVLILLLQAVPIGEPVVQHGPFVMNTAQQINEAMADFQRTRFGGWPWESQAPVHPAGKGRFARLKGEPETVPGA